MQGRIFEFIVLGLWLCIAIVVYIQKDLVRGGGSIIARSLITSEEEVSIKRISLIDNNLFELEIDYGNLSKPVLCKLDCDVLPGSSKEIKSLLRKATRPKVVLIQKQKNDIWLVKINFCLDGKKFSLSNWLASNNLVEK